MHYVELMDNHFHTNHSPDAPETSSMEAMICRGIELGFKRLTITDHCEINRFDSQYDFRATTLASVREARLLAEKYKGKIEVLAGVELGQSPQNFQLAHEIAEMENYDFIIGSIHNARCPKDFSELDFSDRSIDIGHMLDVYFKELYEMTKWNETDTMAHITYPHRYITGKYHIPIDMSKYWDILDETYKNLIYNGKALEINTSGLRQGIHQTLPSKEYLMRFKELGGELITIGSDAHMPEDLGKNIEDGYALLAECGFRYVCYFKDRKPHMVSIA